MLNGTDGETAERLPPERPALPEEIARLTDPGRREDPYPFLDALRARSPYKPFDGLVVVGRHAQISALLRDPALSSARDRAALAPTPRGPRTLNFIHLDPPEHTRYRRLVAGAFARRQIAGLEPRIREIAARLIGAGARTGTFDVVAGLAYPLPLQVICEVLGVPFEDRQRLQEWTGTLSGELEPPLGAAPRRPPVEAARARAAFVRYFRGLIEERRSRPREDLISHLLAVEEHGERLDDHDVLATCVLLLNAGYETTVNLIGNALLALLRHPEQFARLRAAPRRLAPAVVEEVLRYDAPVQLTTRVAREAGTIGEVAMRPGDTVLLLLGAAGRDPEVYPDPGTFDIGRSCAVPHLTFSAGPHFCLGAGLARLEAAVALELFSTSAVRPRLRPGGLGYRPLLNLRGPSRLLIDLDPVRTGGRSHDA